MPADGVRDLFLRALVLFGAAGVLITELLSAFRLIHRGALIACWIVVISAALACIAWSKHRPALCH